MFAQLLNVATALVVLICLWVRRATWRYKWEQPKTIGLALMAVGTMMKVPPIWWLLNNAINGLYIVLAHVFIVSGIASMVYSAEHKLRPESTMRKWHITAIALPWCVGIGLMLTFYLAGADRDLNPALRFPVESPDMWYWLSYDLLVMYFLVLGTHACRHLFHDPPSRRGAGVYLVAMGLGLICALCRVIVALMPEDALVPLQKFLVHSAMGLNAIVIVLFAVGAAFMWTTRLRKMNSRNVTKITAVKPDKPPHRP